MNIAIKKDFNYSLKNRRYHLKERFHFIQDITEKKWKRFIALIFFAKMILSSSASQYLK